MIKVPRLEGPSDSRSVRELAVSPNGRLLAAATDQGLLLYSVVTHELEEVINIDGSAKADVAWSPDGSFLATGSGTRILVWDIANEQLLYLASGHKSAVSDLAWSPDGNQILSIENNGFFHVWDGKTGEPVSESPMSFGLNVLAVSPQGTHIALASDVSVAIWTSVGAEELPLGNKADVGNIAWSQDGHLLAVSGAGGTISIWNINDMQQVATLEGHSKGVTALAWSSSDRYLASTSSDLTTRIWNTETWETIFRLRGHSEIITTVAWDIKERFLFTGSNDGTIRLWPIETYLQ